MYTESYRLAGRTIALKRLEGVPQPGPGNQVLLSAARRAEGDEILIVGPGSIMTVLWAIQAGGHVTVWTENCAEAASLRATCRANDLPVPVIVLDAGFAPLAQTAFDQVMLHLPRGRDRQCELLDLALARLRPDGRLVFAGAKNEGVKPALREARKRFGHAGIVVRKGGYHAGLARRPPGEFESPELTFERDTIIVDGVATDLVTCTGVFAPGRLDPGTANLIAGMNISSRTKVLDIGCGAGLAGLTAARRGADVIWTDVSARAVESARRTLLANEITEPQLHLCHGAKAVEDHSVDTVVTNPPFHQGHDVNYEVSRLFVREACRVLKPGGEVYLVANNFLPYPRWLREHFVSVSIVREDPQFNVYRSQGPRPHR
jgi:16S rRNA (guanine1207-N2)-methyltransferase